MYRDAANCGDTEAQWAEVPNSDLSLYALFLAALIYSTAGIICTLIFTSHAFVLPLFQQWHHPRGDLAGHLSQNQGHFLW